MNYSLDTSVKNYYTHTRGKRMLVGGGVKRPRFYGKIDATLSAPSESKRPRIHQPNSAGCSLEHHDSIAIRQEWRWSRATRSTPAKRGAGQHLGNAHPNECTVRTGHLTATIVRSLFVL